MTSEPIYVEADDDVPDVIERVRNAHSEHVQLVLPSGAPIARSRFNLLLLSQYAGRLGKRVEIVTAHPAVQQMAREAGFDTLVDDQAGEGPPAGDWQRALAAVSGEQPSDPTPSRELDRRLTAGGALSVLPRVLRSPQLLSASTARLTARGPERAVLYGGAGVVLIAGIAAMLFLAPSATVILVAQATPFTRPVQLNVQPGQAPINVRSQTVTQTLSNSFQATGTQTSAGQVAKGTVQYTNNCPVEFNLRSGQQLVSTGGIVFVQQNDIQVGTNATTSASVNAAQPGASGNVGPGEITTIQNNPFAACLSVTNPEAASGGSDGQKSTVISQSDMDQARNSLEKQLETKITQDLQKQVQNGEQMNQQPQFAQTNFNTDHQLNDSVKSFTATITVQGMGSYYNADGVNKAFAAALGKEVPQGKALTADTVKVANLQVTAGTGARLTFTGQASGFIAPDINIAQIKRGLPGKPAGSVKSQLEQQLQVRAVQIRQYPFPLPWLPFNGSRIDLQVRVEDSAAPAAGG
jgi:Baseplate J-like protein